MTHIRRDVAGSDSFGNTWREPGDIVEVPAEQAAILLAIPDFDGVEVLPEDLPKPAPKAATAAAARKTAAKA